jgi:hypothetical protein
VTVIVALAADAMISAVAPATPRRSLRIKTSRRLNCCPRIGDRVNFRLPHLFRRR